MSAKKPRKPRLTKSIVDGLESVYALADVNSHDDSDLYVGCYGDEARKAKIDAAVAWLGSLIHWYAETHRKPI